MAALAALATETTPEHVSPVKKPLQSGNPLMTVSAVSMMR
jgi:hypothetical protein